MRATTTVPVQSGRIVFDNGTSVPLAADSTGALSAAFRIDRPGFYHLEFAGPNGRAVNGSPQYSIDVLDDNGPTISFSKPGRDTRAEVEATHRILSETVRADFERVGFEFVGESDLLRNPADDRSVNVFDSSIRGRTDRFVYRFRKPAR